MNKTELINAVAKNAELSRKDADKAVNAAFDAITAALKAGEKVAVVGFGAFEVKERAARTARNQQQRNVHGPLPDIRMERALRIQRHRGRHRQRGEALGSTHNQAC